MGRSFVVDLVVVLGSVWCEDGCPREKERIYEVRWENGDVIAGNASCRLRQSYDFK
jgi:hypothetical protein